MAFSPDAMQLVSGDIEGRLKIWDTKTGEQWNGWRVPDGIDSLALSPDGRPIACAGRQDAENETVSLWDATTGEPLPTLRGQQDAINSLAFSPDGRVLASASQNRSVRLWDARSGDTLRSVRGDRGLLPGVNSRSDNSFCLNFSLLGCTNRCTPWSDTSLLPDGADTLELAIDRA